MIFGQLEDITGASEILIPAVNDTAALLLVLFERYPGLQGRKFMIAVNQQIVKENTILNRDVQLALLPPFSGG